LRLVFIVIILVYFYFLSFYLITIEPSGCFSHIIIFLRFVVIELVPLSIVAILSESIVEKNSIFLISV